MYVVYMAVLLVLYKFDIYTGVTWVKNLNHMIAFLPTLFRKGENMIENINYI